MITISISDEQLQDAFQKHLDKILEPGNYDNPVKKVLDYTFSYEALKGDIGDKIKEFINHSLDTPLFQQKLGQAIANEMARRAVDAMEKRNREIRTLC